MDLSVNSELGYKIIGAAFEVRRTLGRWVTEAAYERAMQIELAEQGIKSRCQVEFPITYKGHKLGQAYRVDMLVEDCICLEFKAIPVMTERELSQLLSYLNYCGLTLGYLINFHAEDFAVARLPDKYNDGEKLYLEKGIYRIVHKIES